MTTERDLKIAEAAALLERHQKWLNKLPIPTTGCVFQMMHVVGKAQEILAAIPAASEPVAVPEGWRELLKLCIGPINIAMATIGMHSGAKSAPAAYEQCERALDGIHAMLSAAPQPEAQQPAQDDKWHKAVLNECMSVEGCYHPSDPQLTLRELINWHTQEATDVANDVSETVKTLAGNYVRLTCDANAEQPAQALTESERQAVEFYQSNPRAANFDLKRRISEQPAQALTDSDIVSVAEAICRSNGADVFIAFARAIEARLRQ